MTCGHCVTAVTGELTGHSRPFPAFRTSLSIAIEVSAGAATASIV
jgi:hypothetical protein